MDPRVRLGLDFYLEQQCLFVRFAHDDLLEELQKADHQRSVDRIWYCVHAFLTASANIAKVLAPTKGDKARGAELRGAFGIGEESFLLDKSLRDALEHYDERFEKFARKHQGSGFSSFCVFFRGRPDGPTHWLAALDAGTLTVSFLDESCKLGPIRAMIEKLLPKVESDIKALMSKRTSSGWNLNSCEFQ